MDQDIQLIANFGCEMAECPRWHETENCLYWTDMLGGALYRYDPAEDKATRIFQGENIGGLTIQADGSLLCFMEDGSVRSFSDGSLEMCVESVPGETGVRFHDVVADPVGRVFCGTIGSPSQLYRVSVDGSFSVVYDDCSVPNGLDFSPDCSTLYLADTGKNQIHSFVYDKTTGQIGNKALFTEIAEDDGSPDGLTVDSEGHVWVAHVGSSNLVRYGTDGEEVDRIQFQPETITAARFGGTDWSSLYVTTGGGDGNPGADSLDGAVFRIKPTVGGSTAYRSNICFD